MRIWFTLLFLTISFSVSAFAQTTQIYVIDVTSLNFGTNRANVNNGGEFGSFSLSGTTENGGVFSRTSQLNSAFWASFFSCNPCRKNTVFGGFSPGGWITAGNFQVPSEVVINNLQVEVPAWNLRLTPPKRSNLAKRLPVIMHGSITVRDDRNLPNRIEYTDNDVYLTGIMTVEFFQYSANSGLIGTVDWRTLNISVSKPN
jgi:hypothetical protein